MKVFFILCFLICLQNCNNSNIEYYQGYIYDIKNKPIENIYVYEIFDSISKIKTNKNGFFKIKISPNTISRFLIIKDKENILDSIQVIRSSGGEKRNFYFVNGRNDTVFINMELKKIIHQ